MSPPNASVERDVGALTVRWSANASLGGSLEATDDFRVSFAPVASGGDASLAYCDAAKVTPEQACASEEGRL